MTWRKRSGLAVVEVGCCASPLATSAITQSKLRSCRRAKVIIHPMLDSAPIVARLYLTLAKLDLLNRNRGVTAGHSCFWRNYPEFRMPFLIITTINHDDLVRWD